jgi:phosphohistidine phosphatase SixA
MLEGFDSATAFNVEGQREASDINRALAARGVVPGLTLHSTGARLSLAFIENLNLSVLCARPVNSALDSY